MSDVPDSFVLQVTDAKALRKLNQRISETRFAQVKGILEALSDTSARPTSDMLADFKGVLSLRRVSENSNMVAIISEIISYLEVADIDAAKKVADRVLNVPPAPMSFKGDKRGSVFPLLIFAAVYVVFMVGMLGWMFSRIRRKNQE